jgi:hypothetical protein
LLERVKSNLPQGAGFANDILGALVNQSMTAIRTASNPARYVPSISRNYPHPLGLASGNDPEDDGRQPTPISRMTAPHEELPYKVELWDEAKKGVEQVLAVTAHSSIGYAAYYAATREYPDRYLTLRHKNSILNRWNGPEH